MNLNYEMKKLIVFGAGASFGSEKDSMLPLSVSLFTKLVEKYPDSWGQIGEETASVFHEDFEKGMEHIANNESALLVDLQKSMAKFFIKFRPSEKSLYVKLAQKMKEAKWDGSIATLNYDRLLQLSLKKSGLIQTFDSAIFPEIQVCYPHGCCNFFFKGITATNGIHVDKNTLLFPGNRSVVVRKGGHMSAAGPILSTSGGEEISSHNGSSINYSPEGLVTQGEPIHVAESLSDFFSEIYAPFPPIMSYFTRSKFTLSCKNFIDEHRIKLGNLIASADDIVIIGIRIREEDKHVWEPLSKTSARITYCAGNEIEKYLEWANTNRLNHQDDLKLNGYWKENFDKICSVLDL